MVEISGFRFLSSQVAVVAVVAVVVAVVVAAGNSKHGPRSQVMNQPS